MNFNFLSPVQDLVLAHNELLSTQVLGRKLKIHSKRHGVPDLDDVTIAIVGVLENRNDVDYIGEEFQLSEIRKALYALFPGNWHHRVADLGDILKGESVEDTYFALQTTITILLEKKIIPIIIGGSQDLTYANYRAYDNLEQTVNLAVIDNKFDLGNLEEDITSESYLSKIVMEKPNNLFNFSNIGYQTFFNSQEEIDLLSKLHFDAFRLGEVAANVKLVEPIMRDADIVSIDLGAIRKSDAPGNNNAVPNGFYGDQICAISRYAGISRKVSSFGIYEYNAKLDDREQSAHLIAQMIWYFIEGYNFRIDEYPFESKKRYKKYIVLMESDTINFYKSDKSERWWMEISHYHNKIEKSTLIPCTYQDYLTSNNQVYPERWLKTFRKLN